MNIVLVVLDTLRQDHVGCYGNDWIRTPNLDAFASEAVRYTNAYPESLPTLCARRTLYTGKRTFPFHGHRELKGDFPGVAPGWGPIPEEHDTIAELLAASGYRCGLVSDVYHQFKPSKNFHRGFHEWVWVRGQEGDRYRSGPALDDDRLQAHLPSLLADNPAIRKFLTSYLVNTATRRSEDDYFPARVFAEAARWMRENAEPDPFFLVVECFDPHEPWDPPAGDRALYDPDDDVVDVIQSMYGPWDGLLTSRELRRLQANYAGEVTLVDRCFGHFVDELRTAGLLDDTLVVVLSDHGHNLGYPGDHGLVSKQGHPMTHAVADLVLLARHPQGDGAGTTCPALLAHHDVVETMLAVAGADVAGERDGIVVWPNKTGEAPGRDHVTLAWGPLVTVVTDEWWLNASIWGEGALLHDAADTRLERDAADEHPDVCAELLELAVGDAGGAIPPAFARYHDAPGCTPFEDVTLHWQSGVMSSARR